MKRLIFLMVIAIILVACGQQESGQGTKDNVDLEDVETALQEQGLKLKEVNLPASNVLTQKLNSVSPKAFSLKEKTLTIYISIRR